MQYHNHDFYSNFQSGVDSGDVELTTDLWVNELSDLLVNSPEKVIDLLNKTKVPAKLEDSNEELVDKILENIGTNVPLNRGISFLIGEQNNLTSTNPNEDWKGKIDLIANKYQTLLKSVTGSPTLKSSVKTDLMQHIKSKTDSSGKTRINFKAETPAAQKKKNKKVFWYVVGGLALLGGLALTIYLIKKNKGKVDLLESGGAITPAPTLPAVAPTPPVISAAPTPTPVIATPHVPAPAAHVVAPSIPVAPKVV